MGYLCNRYHRKDVLDLQRSGDGAFLISGSVDNSCIIWDVNKGQKKIHNFQNVLIKKKERKCQLKCFVNLYTFGDDSVLQVLSIRFWIPISIMFKVLHGIHWPSMLLPLVLIELAVFTLISLKRKQKSWKRRIMFVSISFPRQNSHQQMIPR